MNILYRSISTDDINRFTSYLETHDTSIREINDLLVYACQYGSYKIVAYMIALPNIDLTYENYLAVKESVKRNGNKNHKVTYMLLKQQVVIDYILGRTPVEIENRSLIMVAYESRNRYAMRLISNLFIRYEDKLVDDRVNSMKHTYDCEEATSIAIDNYALVICEDTNEMARQALQAENIKCDEDDCSSDYHLIPILYEFSRLHRGAKYVINPTIDIYLDKKDNFDRAIIQNLDYSKNRYSATLVHLILGDTGSHFGIIIKTPKSAYVFDSMQRVTSFYSYIFQDVAKTVYKTDFEVAPIFDACRTCSVQATGGFINYTRSSNILSLLSSPDGQNHFCYMWSTVFFGVWCMYSGNIDKVRKYFNNILTIYKHPLVFIKLYIHNIILEYIEDPQITRYSDYFNKYFLNYVDSNTIVHKIIPKKWKMTGLRQLLLYLANGDNHEDRRTKCKLDPSTSVIRDALESVTRYNKIPCPKYTVTAEMFFNHDNIKEGLMAISELHKPVGPPDY